MSIARPSTVQPWLYEKECHPWTGCMRRCCHLFITRIVSQTTAHGVQSIIFGCAHVIIHEIVSLRASWKPRCLAVTGKS